MAVVPASEGSQINPLRSARGKAFIAAFLCAALFAVFTQHAWEDYYITYRASKNLATGHGLVFNVGDRLHTFTSPLGVLLPALASLLTLNSSDDAALWIFRLMGCAAFGGAAVLLLSTVYRGSRGSLIAGVLVVALLCTDAKSVDFTINGMETGFMLLFLAYTLWALFRPSMNRRWVHLGISWGGLMWTRPDSFIYIGLLASGAFIFNNAQRSGYTRKALLAVFGKAALLCTGIYLPWFIGAWVYYGSPIPHTIVAKASVSAVEYSFSGFARTLINLPKLAFAGTSTLDAAFLPSYFIVGGWPHPLIIAARILACLTACLWFAPFVRMEVRAASIAFVGAHVYLTFFPYFPFPWYLPPTALLAFFAWGGVGAQVLEIAQNRSKGLRSILVGTTLILFGAQVALQGWMILAAARQMAALQKHIDTGNRQKIGEWLRQNSKPGDRVFMEPLGYIGFFSGLKTYDWPGLSSREVVQAHAKVGMQWSAVVDYLAPDWIVLRAPEAQEMQRQMPHLLTATYEKVRDFDVRPAVEQLSIRGRRLLEVDALFSVYHRKSELKFPTEMGVIESKYPGPADVFTIENVPVRLVHAPGSVTVGIPSGAKHVRVAYGFRPGAADGDLVTDGAGFQIMWVEGERQVVLNFRELDPVTRADDRALCFFDGELPRSTSGEAKLVLRSIPGRTDTKDWTCWGRAEFR